MTARNQPQQCLYHGREDREWRDATETGAGVPIYRKSSRHEACKVLAGDSAQPTPLTMWQGGQGVEGCDRNGGGGTDKQE